MIVDEAHNNSTPLSFDTIEFLRPRAVVELTATPAKNYNVLKKENMLKLPVYVGEVKATAEETLYNAVQRRAALEQIAHTENDYIRPIALYQAENKNLDYNVDYVKKYLIEVENIPASEIAIATGERYELNGVNLLGKNCAVRHIITVQTLKEG